MTARVIITLVAEPRAGDSGRGSVPCGALSRPQRNRGLGSGCSRGGEVNSVPRFTPLLLTVRPTLVMVAQWQRQQTTLRTASGTPCAQGPVASARGPQREESSESDVQGLGYCHPLPPPQDRNKQGAPSLSALTKELGAHPPPLLFLTSLQSAGMCRWGGGSPQALYLYFIPGCFTLASLVLGWLCADSCPRLRATMATVRKRPRVPGLGLLAAGRPSRSSGPRPLRPCSEHTKDTCMPGSCGLSAPGVPSPSGGRSHLPLDALLHPPQDSIPEAHGAARPPVRSEGFRRQRRHRKRRVQPPGEGNQISRSELGKALSQRTRKWRGVPRAGACLISLISGGPSSAPTLVRWPGPQPSRVRRGWAASYSGPMSGIVASDGSRRREVRSGPGG